MLAELDLVLCILVAVLLLVRLGRGIVARERISGYLQTDIIDKTVDLSMDNNARGQRFEFFCQSFASKSFP